MKIEIDVDVPAGYEPTGEFREPRSGEEYCSAQGGTVYTAKAGDILCRCAILRKKGVVGKEVSKYLKSLVDDGWDVAITQSSYDAQTTDAPDNSPFVPFHRRVISSQRMEFIVSATKEKVIAYPLL